MIIWYWPAQLLIKDSYVWIIVVGMTCTLVYVNVCQMWGIIFCSAVVVFPYCQIWNLNPVTICFKDALIWFLDFRDDDWRIRLGCAWWHVWTKECVDSGPICQWNSRADIFICPVIWVISWPPFCIRFGVRGEIYLISPWILCAEYPVGLCLKTRMIIVFNYQLRIVFVQFVCRLQGLHLSLVLILYIYCT